jgi:hypothetical protein
MSDIFFYLTRLCKVSFSDDNINVCWDIDTADNPNIKCETKCEFMRYKTF